MQKGPGVSRSFFRSTKTYYSIKRSLNVFYQSRELLCDYLLLRALYGIRYVPVLPNPQE